MSVPQPLAADTAPAAEARQIAFFRQRSPAERLALRFDLIAFAVASAREAIRRANPQLEPLEQARLLMVGQQVSDVQWRDVQGIIRVQGAGLDREYLRRWAAVLGLGALLEAALQGIRPAGPPEPPSSSVCSSAYPQTPQAGVWGEQAPERKTFFFFGGFATLQTSRVADRR